MKYFFLAILLASCVTVPDAEDSSDKPSEPPSQGPIKTALPKQEWSDYLYKLVRESGLAKLDLAYEETYCPQTLTEKNFTHLLVAMIKYESNFKASTTYQEGFKNGRGEWVISTGLFQLSYESARSYGCEGATTEKLKDPYFNMECAVKIAKRWIEKDRRVGTGYNSSTAKGLARYWSVMRDRSRPRTKAYLAKWCE